MFHPLPDIDSAELPRLFNCPMCYMPHPLVTEAARRVDEYLATHTEWSREIEQGKMFGVLIVKKQNGEVGYLAAFSGNMGGTNYHEYFVPAVFDFQKKGGTYKCEEAEIMAIGGRIKQIEDDTKIAALRSDIEQLRAEATRAIAQGKATLKANKKARETLRQAGITEEENARLTAESQHQKAELKRLERRYATEIQNLEKQLTDHEATAEALRRERAHRSRRLQRWIFGQFKMLNAQGEQKSMGDIFRPTAAHVPPSGAGECCAPKLLQYAYAHQMHPVAMGEWWKGQSPRGEVRHNGQFYPACHSKCEPILAHMLTGLRVEPNRQRQTEELEIKVVYEDQWLIVIDKPSGLCSVPGRESDDSCIARLKKLYPTDAYLEATHRLDMDTSGLLVVARDAETLRQMHALFAQRKVRKTYEALLSKEIDTESGTIDLPLTADIEDRPRQKVDTEHGKQATTRYRVTGRGNGQTRIELEPLTGRTHQLRVHTAHADGLGSPMVGDNLYGTPANRLHLHAKRIEFEHPQTGKKLVFESAMPF